MWWTAKLAEYNEAQEAFQKEFLDGNAAALRKKFIAAYERFHGSWSEPELDAMEDFAGYFGRIKVADPYVGLNGLGKTSTDWWQDLHRRLMAGLCARRAAGAYDEEIAVWQGRGSCTSIGVVWNAFASATLTARG
jgi:hypothetical protein